MSETKLSQIMDEIYIIEYYLDGVLVACQKHTTSNPEIVKNDLKFDSFGLCLYGIKNTSFVFKRAEVKKLLMLVNLFRSLYDSGADDVRNSIKKSLWFLSEDD